MDAGAGGGRLVAAPTVAGPVSLHTRLGEHRMGPPTKSSATRPGCTQRSHSWTATWRRGPQTQRIHRIHSIFLTPPVLDDGGCHNLYWGACNERRALGEPVVDDEA